jgi:hypothetical protein
MRYGRSSRILGHFLSPNLGGLEGKAAFSTATPVLNSCGLRRLVHPPRIGALMRDITELMNTYRECSRNLWNVYFSRRENIGGSLDAFGQIRELLFDSLVVDELSYEGDAQGDDIPPPVLRVVPTARALILIQRPTEPGQATYWDQEKDMVVGPDDIALAFVDYFDFGQIPIMDFHFYRCKILSFPSRSEYAGREALIRTIDGRVLHDEAADKAIRER